MMITLDDVKQRLLGNRFGRLTVESYIGRDNGGYNIWKCRCDCGNVIVRTTSQIEIGDKAACESCKRFAGPNAEKGRALLLGKKFGRLSVLEYAGNNEHNNRTWKCQCDCGNQVIVKTGSLTSGVTRSCGCFALERQRSAKSHGLSNHPLYSVWWQMKERCYNSKNKSYHNYGGRGIRMCDEWMDRFTNFYQWAITHGYGTGLSIERKDNDGNYEPGNCVWATPQEQSQNTRRVKIKPEQIEDICSDPRTNKEVAKDYNVNESTISRIRTGRTWMNTSLIIEY